MDNYILTEYKAGIHASEIKIHIYRMPVKDLEKIDYEYGKYTRDLRQKNRKTISFYRSLIGSFEKLTIVPKGYEKYEYRSIKLDQSEESLQERKLLERLIFDGLRDSNRNHFMSTEQSIIEKEPIKSLSKCKIHRGIYIDITVKEKGDIFIGFELKHSIQSTHTIIKALKEKKLNKGDKVFDFLNSAHYEFEGISDKTISDPLPELGNKSIIQHYKTKPSIYCHLVKKPNMPAILVRSKSGKVYPYPPQLLKKECLMKDVPAKEHSSIKLNPNDKINYSIEIMKRIIDAFENRYFPIGFEKNNWNIAKLGYRRRLVPDPLLRIGNGATCNHRDLKGAFLRHKIYDSVSSPIYYQLLLDQPFEREWQKKMSEAFITKMENRSRQWGIKLQCTGNQILPTSNPYALRLHLKDINLDTDIISVVLLDETKQEGEEVYSTIKKELGGTRGAHTQVILIDSLKNEYTIPQILLGIYTKAGLQPWVLHQPLHADCYVGYDVSHENGRHTTGIVQVFGKDGSQIFSQPISSAEAGEKVSKETIQTMVIHVLYYYQKKVGKMPQHIVFHRDGRGYVEEIDWIKDILSNRDLTNGQSIAFDYISVIKECGRRMAYFDDIKKKYVNVPGIAYLDDNAQKAYLCSTNPYEKVGMSKPIKIVKKIGEMTLEQIVEDIYHLSFMNIDTDRKVRLPVTTNYADKSSTFFSRGYLSSQKKGIGFV